MLGWGASRRCSRKSGRLGDWGPEFKSRRSHQYLALIQYAQKSAWVTLRVTRTHARRRRGQGHSAHDGARNRGGGDGRGPRHRSSLESRRQDGWSASDYRGGGGCCRVALSHRRAICAAITTTGRRRNPYSSCGLTGWATSRNHQCGWRWPASERNGRVLVGEARAQVARNPFAEVANLDRALGEARIAILLRYSSTPLFQSS